jgi:hypothetical protein
MYDRHETAENNLRIFGNHNGSLHLLARWPLKITGARSLSEVAQLSIMICVTVFISSTFRLFGLFHHSLAREPNTVGSSSTL